MEEISLEKEHSGKILCVDDDKMVLGVLERIVRLANYEPVCTKNGEEALKKFGSGEGYILVLTDINMPGKDGIKLAEEIRRVSNVPIVAVTAYGNESVMKRCAEAGIDGYLVKPFLFDTLIETINEYSLKNNSNTLSRMCNEGI